MRQLATDWSGQGIQQAIASTMCGPRIFDPGFSPNSFEAKDQARVSRRTEFSHDLTFLGKAVNSKLTGIKASVRSEKTCDNGLLKNPVLKIPVTSRRHRVSRVVARRTVDGLHSSIQYGLKRTVAKINGCCEDGLVSVTRQNAR